MITSTGRADWAARGPLSWIQRVEIVVFGTAARVDEHKYRAEGAMRVVRGTLPSSGPQLRASLLETFANPYLKMIKILIYYKKVFIDKSSNYFYPVK